MIVSKKFLFEGEEIELKYDSITEILDKFSEEYSYAYEIITPEIAYLVRENILLASLCDRSVGVPPTTPASTTTHTRCLRRKRRQIPAAHRRKALRKHAAVDRHAEERQEF